MHPAPGRDPGPERRRRGGDGQRMPGELPYRPIVVDGDPPGLTLLVMPEGHHVAAHVHEETRVAGQVSRRPTDTESLTHPGQIQPDALRQRYPARLLFDP